MPVRNPSKRKGNSRVKSRARLKASNPVKEEEQKQSFDQLSALYSQLAVIHAITKTLSQTLNLEKIFYEAVTLIKDALGVETVLIFTVDWPKSELLLRAERGTPKELLPIIARTKLGETFSGQAAHSKEPIYVEDLLTNSKAGSIVAKDLRPESPGSLVAIPFKTRGEKRGKTFGVLTVRDKKPKRFTPQERRLLSSVADELALAVENASLFEEVKSRSHELRALVSINKDITGLLDKEALLRRIAEVSREILKVDGVSFRLIEGGFLVRAAHSGGKELLVLREKLELGESITGKIIQEKRVIAIKNVLEDSTIIEEHRELLRKAGYRSFLGVPLKVDTTILGTLNLYSEAEREFQLEEINLITAFADQAAIAVQNALLFAEISKKTARLEQLNRELQEANLAKAQFMAAMSHELRTPLNVIMGYAELAREGFLGEPGERLKDAFARIQRNAEVLLKLVVDVLTLVKVGAGKMFPHVSTFNVEQIITHVRTYAEQLNRDKDLEVLWRVEENLPLITTDPLKLEEILQNLVGNAFKFTPQGRIEVQARDLKGEERVEFAVADTGIGIKRENLEKIFDEFYQLREAHTGNYSGVGLGLSIVKKYLELMEGKIRVDSQEGKGSTFTFTLPYSIKEN